MDRPPATDEASHDQTSELEQLQAALASSQAKLQAAQAQLQAEDGGGTPAVALTAFARSEDRRQAMLAGFDVHVAKPVAGQRPPEVEPAAGHHRRFL